MCSETNFTQAKCNFHPTTGIPNSSSYCCCPPDDHLQEAGLSGLSFAKGRSLWIIICKRPAPHFDNHKCIFETLHTEIKCVLSVKESNFNEKKRSKFSHLLTVRAEVADPPPPPYGQPDQKISVFYAIPNSKSTYLYLYNKVVSTNFIVYFNRVTGGAR